MWMRAQNAYVAPKLLVKNEIGQELGLSYLWAFLAQFWSLELPKYIYAFIDSNDIYACMWMIQYIHRWLLHQCKYGCLYPKSNVKL